MNFQKNDLGLTIEEEAFMAFFGNAKADLTTFQQSYPQFRFVRVKQDHTDQIFDVDSFLQENPVGQAGSVHHPICPQDSCFDALWTSTKRTAIVLQTADCIPLMVYSPIKKQIAAVHAGWRGVENHIIPKALQKFTNPQTLKIFIGPHILQNSFEVQQDVKERLEDATNEFYSNRGSKPEFNKNYVQQKNNRYSIDLQKIVLDQLEALEIQQENILCANIDTKTNPEFNSHRRTPTVKVRNWSWIGLKP